MIGHGRAQVSPCESLRIDDPSPTDSWFGHAAAVRGNEIVVGAPSPAPGRAFVYERKDAGWELSATLQASDAADGQRFGWSAAIDGGVALVGRRDDGVLNSKGSAYVFTRRPDGTWPQTQKITIPDAECWAFGWSMAMDGNRAAIAAKGASALGGKGRVFVFEREGSTWVQKAKIIPSLDTLDDWFGAAVALEGDRLVIGAPKGGTGRAYVFDRQSSGDWVQQALLLPTDLASADEYGYAVALRGDAVAIGAVAHDKPFINGGAVYLFEKGPEGWQQTYKFAEQPWGALPRYGYSLSLTDEELLVGAPAHWSALQAAGIVYSYRRSTNGWSDAIQVAGSNPTVSGWFGASLARDGDQFAVGASGQTSTTAPGRVHLFSYDGGAHLNGASSSVALGAGGAQAMQLGACAQHAGDFYLLLGSATGIEPGVPLGNAVLPLLPDAYLAQTLSQPNSSILQGSLGVLDAWGRGYATFELPPGVPASLAGLTLHHAYLVFDAVTLEVKLASNPIPVLLTP